MRQAAAFLQLWEGAQKENSSCIWTALKIFTNDRKNKEKTGTRELRHQKCCTLRTFPNLFKFCVRSKTRAKSSTVICNYCLLTACSIHMPHSEITLYLAEDFKNRFVCNCPLLPLIGLYKKAYFPAFLSVGLSPSLFLCVRWLTDVDQCFIARSKCAACFFPAVRAIPWCTSSTEPRPPPTIIPLKYII